MTDARIPRYPYVHVDVETEDDAEIAGALLFDAGATGLEERDADTLSKGAAAITLVASFETDAEAEAAREALAERWPARVEHVIGDDWKERWKEFFRPTRVGERLVIRPSWEEVEPRAGEVVLTLDPGHAFGTGTHETTRLVLAEVEARVKGGEQVLDVGCGSGILGVAALLLGAARVVAVDVDDDAAEVTRENAEINGVRIEASTTPIDEVEGRFDLVLANIRAPILIPMVEALAARTAGLLVLSGLLATEEAEVRAVYDPRMPFESRRVDGEWLALVYRSGVDRSGR